MITRRDWMVGGVAITGAAAIAAPAALRLASSSTVGVAELAERLQPGRVAFDHAARVALDLLRGQESLEIRYAEIGDLAHALQCATRALRNAESEEYVVCALLHDVGQHLNPHSHDKLAGELLRFRVSERNHWIVANHQIFQAGERRHQRFDLAAAEHWRGHPHFEAALRFSELYDMQSLAEDGESLRLADFEPMVHRVFAAAERLIAYPLRP
jgi:predicted HD phosphohydrolase